MVTHLPRKRQKARPLHLNYTQLVYFTMQGSHTPFDPEKILDFILKIQGLEMYLNLV